MKVKKAVIPAAGWGTRMLPVTKSVPKELLYLAGKPVLQYIIEEAVASGIEEILIITNRGKSAIGDYFDYHPDLEETLSAAGKSTELAAVHDPADLANLYFIRQKEAKGLGHAIGKAKGFVGNEPFAVLLGDDIMQSPKPVLRQLIDAAEKYKAAAIGVQQVADEALARYSSVQVEPLEPRVFKATDMVEKPKPDEAFSNYAILGRYVLTPDVFDLIEQLKPGYGGEIQLTDALKQLCRQSPMVAVDFEGRRFDTGNPVGFLEATLEFSARDPETGPWLQAYIQQKAKHV